MKNKDLKKVIVVDLDGTLVSENTFHMWLRYLLKITWKHNFYAFLKIMFFMGLRGTRVINHEQLKKNIIVISNQINKHLNLEKFVDSLMDYANVHILNELKDKSKEEYWILATAAPQIYAEVLAESYEFDLCIGTSMIVDSNWVENIRENKLHNVLEILNDINIKGVHCLYTDHYDDIHLMQISDEINLVNPSEKTMSLTLSSNFHNVKQIS
ncbi:haloacid dehalogenase-like hydrolase [Priestia megaterium]|uniref:haloacid dehalogenase-like hydrolase n=1 Tax=Priestia megaterium TaxID=1404 RepID=UPI002E1C5387|nr:haloacid dehalogenase-like hydrolase [Priestia megaterium]